MSDDLHSVSIDNSGYYTNEPEQNTFYNPDVFAKKIMDEAFVLPEFRVKVDDIGRSITTTSNSLIIQNPDLTTTHITIPKNDNFINTSVNLEDEIMEKLLDRLSKKPILQHKCNNCGANVLLDNDKHIFRCPYCNSTYAIGTAMINDRG